MRAIADTGSLLNRWDRIAIGVRCGYNPHCACAVRVYIGVGHRVAQSGLVAPARAYQRTLEVLLQTARDEALPWFWRSVCLEHTTLPLARLTSLLKESDPIALYAMESAILAARGLLAMPRSRVPRAA